LLAFQPDVIYVNSVASLPAFEAIGLRGVPVLLHVHELDSHLDEYLPTRAWLGGLPDRYLAVSEAVRSALIERGIPAERVSVIHDFVPDEYVSEERPPKGGEPGYFVVGGAGYPSWRKGLCLWLQMAAALVSLLPEHRVEFHWVGAVENPETRAARYRARRLGIADRVRFIPYTASPLDHYLAFDVFAMTSWEDPCPLVVLENMALGKPVLCFRPSGGAPEEVGDAGIVISRFCPYAMAEAAAELALIPDRRAALGRAAQERVKRSFVSSVQAPRVLFELTTTAKLSSNASARTEPLAK
jgi:glycosyltransferase involved in cell wall biosynthesis